MLQFRRLQFYADKENKYSNQLFSFYISSNENAFRVLLRFFQNGNTFRSIYINDVTKVGKKEIIFTKEIFSYYNFFKLYNPPRQQILVKARDSYYWYIRTGEIIY